MFLSLKQGPGLRPGPLEHHLEILFEVFGAERAFNAHIGGEEGDERDR
jgi:hypothetical protein